MRIITGKRKGMRLASPKGNKTRPTESRIKESLFNILTNVSGSIVCDIFAGSGAIGLEFLSRDADLVYFIENNRDVLPVLKSNINKTKLANYILLEKDYKDALKDISNSNHCFDYVFVDPPYAFVDFYNNTLELINHYDNFNDSLIIVEAYCGLTLEKINLYNIIDKRKYRNTVLYFLRRR